ncbi:MAG: radical SAM protein [Elusimicrobia bacterium]|nr:radical SAM protein [Elusimicrobiota bacterium]MDE2236790.1 radical SAM protein [Elusimicrobiota bacterium]MDE2424993.1 radical SAM protein [Elusimicrobiota bacterium]
MKALKLPEPRPARDLRRVSSYPCQLELSIGEKCNLACDYCFVDKSSPAVARWSAVRRAIDTILSYPHERFTITFTTMEPLLHAETWKRAVDHILSVADKKGLEVKIITTTNGLLLTDSVRRFIEATDERLWINISLDGLPASHNRHRLLHGGSGRDSFALSWKNFDALPRNRTRVICTICPSEAPALSRNLDFFLQEGFLHIDLFPDILSLWSRKRLALVSRQIERFIERINPASGRYNLRLLNRLWGTPYNEKILFGSDERYYAYEGVLLIPYEQRAPYIVGNAADGPDLALRQRLFGDIFSEFARRTGDACAACRFNGICSYPTPLLLWCDSRGLDLRRYFDSFGRVAQAFIELSQRVEERSRNATDEARLRSLR